MRFAATSLAGVHVVELERHGDERGFFGRVFCADEFRRHQLTSSLVQVNNSFNAKKGTLRGMHYQLPPRAETKIVRCVRGALWDVALDLRPDSPTFGKWFGVELTADNRRMLYGPKGFAHGFITLADDTEAFYFVDESYAPELERGVRWDDPKFKIEWPIQPIVVSDKDRKHPDFDPACHLNTPDGGGGQ